jgi:hypothetical protein
MYCESQQGYLRRYDRRTGASIDIQPQPGKGEDAFRFNWDSPILISPHRHTRLYFGSNRLHRSDDRGDSWTTISPDLSRNLDRLKLKLMDRVWSIDAVWDLSAMSKFGNITSISESPLVENLIYVGTDDGLIQVTEDGGKHWRKIDKIYGVPEFAFVNDIKADLHDPNAAYVALDNHKIGDFKPYLMKTTNRGETWESIAGDLPDRHLVWRIVQDHVKKDLLFAGTEFGLFFTLDGGQHWIKLTGGAPTIPFRDLEIQQREDDLVAASFGRSFFVFDDYSPLRTVSDQLLTDNEFVLFPVKKALLYVPARVLGGQKGSQGDAFFAAPNPPFGAVFTYYLRDTLKTKKRVRREQEAERKKAGEDNPYPGFDALKQEEREEDPGIVFTITDADGEVVDRVTGPTSAGFHRVSWDLRYAPPTVGGGQGPLAAPGVYRVSAAKRVGDATTPLGSPQTFEAVPIGEPAVPLRDRQRLLQFQLQAGQLQHEAAGANGKLDETLEQLGQIKRAIRQTRAPADPLYEAARKLELELLAVRDQLAGDATRTRRGHTAPPSIMQRVRNAASGSLNDIQGPTTTQRRDYEIAREEYQAVSARLKQLVEVELVKLQQQLEAAGTPWTSGRPIP